MLSLTLQFSVYVEKLLKNKPGIMRIDSPPPGPPPDGVRVAGVGAEFPSPSPIERQIRTVIERQKSILSIGQPATAAASTPVQPSKP